MLIALIFRFIVKQRRVKHSLELLAALGVYLRKKNRGSDDKRIAMYASG